MLCAARGFRFALMCAWLYACDTHTHTHTNTHTHTHNHARTHPHSHPHTLCTHAHRSLWHRADQGDLRCRRPCRHPQTACMRAVGCVTFSRLLKQSHAYVHGAQNAERRAKHSSSARVRGASSTNAFGLATPHRAKRGRLQFDDLVAVLVWRALTAVCTCGAGSSTSRGQVALHAPACVRVRVGPLGAPPPEAQVPREPAPALHTRRLDGSKGARFRTRRRRRCET